VLCQVAFDRQHDARWSETNPAACMYAYAMVGPTNVMPRRLRSADKVLPASVVVGRSDVVLVLTTGVPPTNDHTYASNEPNSAWMARNTRAFCRTDGTCAACDEHFVSNAHVFTAPATVGQVRQRFGVYDQLVSPFVCVAQFLDQ
jgi:hypothetical protein